MAVNICEKRRSVLNEHGHCLVLGGPGSGKTTLGLLKALGRMERLRSGQSILFLSFSRAAVARVASAALDQLPHDKKNLLSVQTFHSFFWQVLQGHGYLLDCPRQLRIIQSHEETSLRNGIKPDDTLLWAEWEDRRLDLFRDSGRICFDLFAPLARQLLSGAKRLRERLSSRYPLIIVDEAQDTNNEQWECVRLLSAISQIICLADPDQMIYGHLPGVNADRLPLIRETLQPLEIDLGDENNRSPGTDIALFARDIYRGKMSQASYKGISIQQFDRKAEKRDKAIRASIPILVKAMEKETGLAPTAWECLRLMLGAWQLSRMRFNSRNRTPTRCCLTNRSRFCQLARRRSSLSQNTSPTTPRMSRHFWNWQRLPIRLRERPRGAPSATAAPSTLWKSVPAKHPPSKW